MPAKLIKPLAAAVAALVVTGGATLALGGRDNGTYRVTAYFDKTIGLFERSDVTILGVPVGKIAEIEPEGDRVRVEMDVDERHRVPADAFAQIVPISIIADRYIQLEPVYTGGPALQDGDVLDIDRTQIPAELDDAFQQLKKLLDAVEPGEEGEPGALGDLIVQLNEALSGHEEDLRGTIVTGAEVSRALADARDDLSGLLVNLDDLFSTLSTRAGSIGQLNRNFAVVMGALAESRRDLEGALAGLADMTNEVGTLVQRHRRTLGPDLGRAARVAAAVLRNRASVEESLAWLPVVGEALIRAHHGPPVKATDVRDNLTSTKCKELEQLPEPIQDALSDLIEAFCGTERPQQQQQQQQTAAPPPPVELNCDEGIRKVRRQIRQIVKIEGLPDEVRTEVIRPLRRQLRALKQRCEELGSLIEDPDKLIQDLLEQLEDTIGDIPGGIDPRLRDLRTRDLVGSAAGTVAAPAGGPGPLDRAGSWFRDLLAFVGGRR